MNIYSIDEILTSPHTAPIPEEGTILETLCIILGRCATIENFHNIITYADRLPEEYNVLLIKTCIAYYTKDRFEITVSPLVIKFAELVETEIFTKWANRHSEILT